MSTSLLLIAQPLLSPGGQVDPREAGPSNRIDRPDASQRAALTPKQVEAIEGLIKEYAELAGIDVPRDGSLLDRAKEVDRALIRLTELAPDSESAATAASNFHVELSMQGLHIREPLWRAPSPSLPRY
jgi:hypothetical protein